VSRYWNDASETDIEIINQALDLIHARNIATIGAGLTSEEEQKVANIYEDTRDLLLSRFDWNFTMESATILNCASSLAGHIIPDDYSYKSTLPTDCLRVLEVRNYSGAWKRYQKLYLLCDINTNTDDLEIRYIKQETDADLFDPNFREIFILKLAQKLAPAIGDGSREGLDLYKMEEREIGQAKRVHAIEDAEYADEDTHEDEDEWVTAGR
jgi:hypothetical protein